MSKAAVVLLLALSSHGCKHREETFTDASSAKEQPQFDVNVECGKTATSFFIKVAGSPRIDQMTIGSTCYTLAPALRLKCWYMEGGYFVSYDDPNFKGHFIAIGPYKDIELCQTICDSIYLNFKTAAAAAPATP